MGPSDILLAILAAKTLAAPLDGQAGSHKPVVQDGILQLPLIGIPTEMEITGGNTTKRQVSVGQNNLLMPGIRPITALGIPLEIGTPPQTVIVEPDTASSKFWVPGIPEGQVRQEPESLYFDPQRSSSIKNLKKKEMSYYVSETASLDLVSDEVSIGGKSLGRLRLGVGNLSESKLGREVGVLGLLKPKRDDGWAEDFILKRLLDQKHVKSRAFSTGVRTKGHGSLIFGGYDTAKFSGPLEKLPMKPSDDNSYIVGMASLSLFGVGNSSQTLLDEGIRGKPLTIGLDSGTPGLVLPLGLFAKVQAKLNAGVSREALTVDCEMVDSGTGLDFKMTNNATISALLADFLVSRLAHGKQCHLAIGHGRMPADLWIGGHFLRRSYVVYDPDNSNIYVARGADCGSNLVPINGTMSDGVIGKCDWETPTVDAPVDQAPTSHEGEDEDEDEDRDWDRDEFVPPAYLDPASKPKPTSQPEGDWDVSLIQPQ